MSAEPIKWDGVTPAYGSTAWWVYYGALDATCERCARCGCGGHMGRHGFPGPLGLCLNCLETLRGNPDVR